MTSTTTAHKYQLTNAVNSNKTKQQNYNFISKLTDIKEHHNYTSINEQENDIILNDDHDYFCNRLGVIDIREVKQTQIQDSDNLTTFTSSELETSDEDINEEKDDFEQNGEDNDMGGNENIKIGDLKVGNDTHNKELFRESLINHKKENSLNEVITYILVENGRESKINTGNLDGNPKDNANLKREESVDNKVNDEGKGTVFVDDSRDNILDPTISNDGKYRKDTILEPTVGSVDDTRDTILDTTVDSVGDELLDVNFLRYLDSEQQLPADDYFDQSPSLFDLILEIENDNIEDPIQPLSSVTNNVGRNICNMIQKTDIFKDITNVLSNNISSVDVTTDNSIENFILKLKKLDKIERSLQSLKCDSENFKRPKKVGNPKESIEKKLNYPSKKFLCSQCEQSFDNVPDWVHHFNSHVLNQLFKCIPCKLSFISLESYRDHLAKDHPETRHKAGEKS